MFEYFPFSKHAWEKPRTQLSHHHNLHTLREQHHGFLKPPCDLVPELIICAIALNHLFHQTRPNLLPSFLFSRDILKVFIRGGRVKDTMASSFTFPMIDLGLGGWLKQKSLLVEYYIWYPTMYKIEIEIILFLWYHWKQGL